MIRKFCSLVSVYIRFVVRDMVTLLAAKSALVLHEHGGRGSAAGHSAFGVDLLSLLTVTQNQLKHAH